ncbi:MAG: hypothetical protein ACI9KS_001226 [Sulfitobacter sp.]|jgi:hypothetical protein
MTNLVLSLTKFGPYRSSIRVGLLHQLSEAYRNSCKFQTLPAERLEDMGLTKLDQTQAGFGGFFERAGCS